MVTMFYIVKRLHFMKIISERWSSDMERLCGLKMMLPCEKTRSIGALEAGQLSTSAASLHNPGSCFWICDSCQKSNMSISSGSP